MLQVVHVWCVVKLLLRKLTHLTFRGIDLRLKTAFSWFDLENVN